MEGGVGGGVCVWRCVCVWGGGSVCVEGGVGGGVCVAGGGGGGAMCVCGGGVEEGVWRWGWGARGVPELVLSCS